MNAAERRCFLATRARGRLPLGYLQQANDLVHVPARAVLAPRACAAHDTMYDRVVRVGSTPVLNAVSCFLTIASGALAVLSLFVQREKTER